MPQLPTIKILDLHKITQNYIKHAIFSALLSDILYVYKFEILNLWSAAMLVINGRLLEDAKLM